MGIPIFERLQGRCSLGSHRLECCGIGYINPGTAVAGGLTGRREAVPRQNGHRNTVGEDRDGRFHAGRICRTAGGLWDARARALGSDAARQRAVGHGRRRYWWWRCWEACSGTRLRTDWRTLYADLDPDDARQMAQILTQAQIPFDATPNGGGSAFRPRNWTRRGSPPRPRAESKADGLGFEIFDKPNWVGSEFDEQVNYQRALEGELEHTVGTLADVESARVHLVMPHDSLFRDQERPAKASVVLKLRHRSLADGEPDAIRNLVASAVDGLTPDRWCWSMQPGILPLGPKTADALRLTAEQALEEKLVSTLEPVTGAGNVRASVTLDYDPRPPTRPRRATIPTRPSRSPCSGPSRHRPAAVAAGVPGTASNAPNTQALPVYPRADHASRRSPRPSREPMAPRRRCVMFREPGQAAPADGGHRGQRPADAAGSQGQSLRSGSRARPRSCAT